MVPHLPMLVVMVAMFFMCEIKVSNLFFRPVATGWLQAICFVNFFICIGKISDFSCIKI